MYETVIGLEVHIHLKTKTKIFCRCQNLFGGAPNTHICPVCTGQPGSLPVFNKNALKQALKASLVLHCRVNRESVFERKQYFYPDLPKNYQISQYAIPLAENGYMFVDGVKINITRAHLEEDAGKLIHSKEDHSMVDYNRTGSPLLEIVSEPEISSPLEASQYLKTLRQLMRYAGVSDCDMEKGSMRCDANISLRIPGQKELGVKVEIKNLNSFKAVEKALEYEQYRQSEALSSNSIIVQETRLWNDDLLITKSMRSKEEANDYRYFPDPDLPVLCVEQEEVESVRALLPEMPQTRKERYIKDYELSEYDSGVITQDKEIADYFEEVLSNLEDVNNITVKLIVNWLSVELLGKLNASDFTFSAQPVRAKDLADLILSINNGDISGKMAKEIFEIMWNDLKSPLDIINERGMKQISDEGDILDICQKVIDANPEIVQKFHDGKEGVIGALVGSVMKETRGQANPKIVNKKLVEILKS